MVIHRSGEPKIIGELSISLKVKGDPERLREFREIGEYYVRRSREYAERLGLTIEVGEDHCSENYRDSRISILGNTGEVVVDGRKVHLSPTELKLLYALVHRDGTGGSSDELGGEVWGDKYHLYSPTVLRFYAHSLRGKLEKDPSNPEIITTVRGRGYKFNHQH